jgi:phosphomannomutase
MLFVEETDAAGGIGVTASHNPAEWNALKFASAEGTFLDGTAMAEFQRQVRDEEPDRASWAELGERSRRNDATERHLERILSLSEVDVDALRARAFHVALDCVNGAGSLSVPLLLEALGCRIDAIGMTPDGHFPRDPEPTAANLRALGDLVQASGAEVGMAVDPDVDRLSLVDEQGRPLGEDYTLALASAVVLSRTPGTVVTNLSTSQVVEDVARAHGGRVVRAPVGEINVARRMQDVGAVVGGEGNGGVILPSLHYTRDAPLGVALILQHLLDTERSLSEAVAALPNYSIVKEKVGFAREALPDAYAALVDDLAPPETDTEDGLRLAWPDRSTWLHVRPSGTEPVVRLIAEAPSPDQAQALVDRAGRLLEGVV